MNFNQVRQDIFDSVNRDNYEGYDPFDFLNSPFLRKLKLDEITLIRLAWLQLGKRLPVNIRPIIGVPKLKNPKGVALFILGMLEDYHRTGNDFFLQEASMLADWLITQQSDKLKWKYPCWGYHFDWQARAFYVPKGKPNIITTCYVARALYELGKVVGSDEYLEISLNSANFIYEYLLTKNEGRNFFAYIPGETTFVHNANLWGASWVAHAGTKLGNEELKSVALDVARQSVKEQNEDGSWVYGARHHHQFIDGFHTGYNLEALDKLRKSLKITEFDDAINSGMRYYRDHLFLEDGTAKYYNNNIYPLDMHSFSQGVLSLLIVGGECSDILLAKKIMQRAVEMMYLEKKHRFIYQKHRWITNKVNYIRWTQAWSYYGLAFFNRYMIEYVANEAN
jgi:polysaccharide biosynthesis protein VpsJ